MEILNTLTEDTESIADEYAFQYRRCHMYDKNGDMWIRTENQKRGFVKHGSNKWNKSVCEDFNTPKHEWEDSQSCKHNNSRSR